MSGVAARPDVAAQAVLPALDAAARLDVTAQAALWASDAVAGSALPPAVRAECARAAAALLARDGWQAGPAQDVRARWAVPAACGSECSPAG